MSAKLESFLRETEEAHSSAIYDGRGFKLLCIRIQWSQNKCAALLFLWRLRMEPQNFLVFALNLSRGRSEKYPHVAFEHLIFPF